MMLSAKPGLSRAKQGVPRVAAIVRALGKEEKTVTMDTASYGRSRLVAGSPLPSSSISFGMTLVMAIACGVAAANIYYNQPMLGIMEAAFPGQVTVIGPVPTATQLGTSSACLSSRIASVTGWAYFPVALAMPTGSMVRSARAT